VMLMGHQVMGLLGTGQVPGPLGTAAPSTTPNGAFRASDGWIVVATANDKQFARLCRALGLPELADDPRFLTVASRVAARDELQPILDGVFLGATVDEWVERLRPAGVPAGRLNDLRQALEHPLTEERGLLVQPPPGGRPEDLLQIRLPIDAAGSFIRRPPPLLGEHTEEVLREAGFDETEIQRLTGRGVDSSPGLR
jgi:crotonobetainyl-CoA:carnitine CoA-transferase CaiB-like acyl-CoA transferase